MQVGNAGNLEEFWQLIEKGSTCFNALSDQRKKDLFDRFGEGEIAVGSYLDRVDLFDNDFFNIPLAEAGRMDPEQRLMLECALKAVHNSGYQVKELKGQRIGIYHAYGESMYQKFFDDNTNLSLTSHLPGMIGTRVANFMDWRGPVVGVDTTCSSALTALYSACMSIAAGDCTMALVGGVELGVKYKEMNKHIPIMSKSQRCIPFDKDADGTLDGEGAFCILVKDAEDAIRDGDPIHAIIKGGAINHGGAMIQNISAPSPVSQSEVIQLAWENTQTDPKNVRFIEAHGTGTILGDPIEFMGVTSAFESVLKNEKTSCAMSSVKGQLGHLGPVAGLAGLVRLVLALKNKQLLPQLGFKEINEHIDEKNSSVRIQREMEFWESEGKVRIGGVSSYGMTGTNVHLVLEEYEASVLAPVADRTFLLKIGGRTIAKAEQIRTYLQQYIQANPNVDLAGLCNSVNKILDDSEYHQVLLFKNKNELSEALAKPLFINPTKKSKVKEVFLLIPEILQKEQLTSLVTQSDRLSVAYELLENELISQNITLTENGKIFLFHYCAAELLIEMGISPDKIIGGQSGKLMSALLSGILTWKEALTQFENNDQEGFNSQGFIQFLNSLNPDVDYLLTMMGNSGEMMVVLKEWLHENDKKNIQVIIPNEEYDVCLQIVRDYCKLGNTVNFDYLMNRSSFVHDLHLPILEPKRFWPSVKPAFGAAAKIESNLAVVAGAAGLKINKEEILARINAIWCEKLKLSFVNNDDDFFDLGGSSLLGLDVLQLIEKRLEISLEYADIFDYSTVEAQAKLIFERLTSDNDVLSEKKQKVTIDPDSIKKREMDYTDILYKIGSQKEEIKRISPERILITGGTGFLGVYIIKDLLLKTNADIFCLVRAETDHIAAERLISNFKSYFPDYIFDHKRLKGIKGDVTVSDLGLSAESDYLLYGINSVYHLAANVRHFGKQETVNKINFEGTVNILEWSKKAGVRYFNHFSTSAVASGSVPKTKTVKFYETDFDLGQDYGREVYPLSKFKAEQYIIAHRENLNVNVFRIGNIGGDSTTGLFQHNIEENNFYQRLKTLSRLEYYSNEILQHSFETTPVDLVAKITTELSLHENTLINTFHIMEQDPLRLINMIPEFEKLNINLEKINHIDFMKHINQLGATSYLASENTFLGITKFNTEVDQTEFEFMQEATRKYLDRIGVNHAYDKAKYAGVLIRNCIQRGFIKQGLEVKSNFIINN